MRTINGIPGTANLYSSLSTSDQGVIFFLRTLLLFDPWGVALHLDDDVASRIDCSDVFVKR